jgi:hypothetical protein
MQSMRHQATRQKVKASIIFMTIRLRTLTINTAPQHYPWQLLVPLLWLQLTVLWQLMQVAVQLPLLTALQLGQQMQTQLAQQLL